MGISSEDRKGNMSQFTKEPALLEKLLSVSKMFAQQQRVVYADSGTAFNIAVEYIDTPEVQEFVNKCFDGVVTIFLDQRASCVRTNLLHNFDLVLIGSCKIILWDLKVNYCTRYLDTLRRLVCNDHTYYTSPDTVDSHSTEMSAKAILAQSRGPKTRRKIIEMFEADGGFDMLQDMLSGKVRVCSEVLTEEKEKKQDVESKLSGEQVRLLLQPFVYSRDIIGNARAVTACHLAIAAVECMDEDMLKVQRSIELTKLHRLLKLVLVNDEKLKEFLRSLSLKTFASKAFQLRKLGLDLMCKLVGESQQQFQQSTPYSSLSSPGIEDELASPDNQDLVVSESSTMTKWLVDNEVLEKLFASTESVHPALVGRSKKLLEFLAHADAVQEKHIDQMFKSCVGHHDSVRGAVQTLLAELAVDTQVKPNSASHILECAQRLVSHHRSDMIFFVDKLFGTSSNGYQRQLLHCSPVVLRALLDLLWCLLETSPDLSDPNRSKLVDYFVDILRLPNGRILRARYIVTYIEILQTSCSSSLQTGGDNEAVKIFTAYEALQKVISLFDVVSMTTSIGGPNNGTMTPPRRTAGSKDSTYDFYEGDLRVGYEEEDDDFRSAIESVTPEDEVSLIVNITTNSSNGRVTKSMRTQSELIIELQSRYKILELVVEETKAHRDRSGKTYRTNRESMLIHMQTLQCRLDFLQFCVSRSPLMLSFDLVHQLWEALDQPVEREVCMVWLRQVAVVDIGLRPGLSPEVTRQVFQKLLCGDMDFKQLSEPGFKCFSAFFLDVNRAEDILEGEVFGAFTSSASTSSSILNTHAAGSRGAGSPGSGNGEQQGGGESENTSPGSSEQERKQVRKKKNRTSFFTDFFPSIRSTWSGGSRGKTKNENVSGSNSNRSSQDPLGAPTSPNEITSPSSGTIGGGANGGKLSGFSRNQDVTAVGDTRVMLVKRPDVVGIDTLWRIVESAPPETASRAMNLLLQVQCRIEGLGDSYRQQQDRDVFQADLDGKEGEPGNSLELSGLQRRIEFLDRTFDFLEHSVHGKDSQNASDKVQRCIRLITFYLQSFPQSAKVTPHAPPKGVEIELTVHHDRLLLFSKLDIGKLLQVAVPARSSTTTRRAQTGSRFLSGIILDYIEDDEGKHVIWFIDGRTVTRNMSSLQSQVISVKTSENSYQMQPRSHFTDGQVPFQAVSGVEMPEEVVEARGAYKPLILRVKDRFTLGTLHRMILDAVVTNHNREICPLTLRTISLSAQIHHQNVQQNEYHTQAGDYAHERFLIGAQHPLHELLPEASKAAKVEKTPLSKLVHHVLNLDVDTNSEADSPLAVVEDESELPSVLITAKDSKYSRALMALLDNQHISDVTRIELWDLLLALPTDQSLLSHLETEYESINWDEELRSESTCMLRAVYVLMVVNSLLGNEPRSGTRQQMGNSSSVVWRSSFIKTGGFQDVCQLLGTVLSDKISEPVVGNWFMYWQRSIALPVIIKIVHFCVRGSIELQDSTAQAPTSSDNDKNTVGIVELLRRSDKDYRLGEYEFSPASKKSISKDTDLKLLASNLSKLIVVAHRVTCSQSGAAVSDDDEQRRSEFDEFGEDDDDDDDDDSSQAFDDDEDDEDSIVRRRHDATRSGETDGVTPAMDEKDEAMLQVLIDGIRTACMIANHDSTMGEAFLSSQVATLKTGRLLGANTITDVFVLSRFAVVREMMCDLLRGLCANSKEECAFVQALVLDTLSRIPRNCRTCDDFFSFVRLQILNKKFTDPKFGDIVTARLIHYPPLSKRQLRREARLMGQFSVHLRNVVFKPRAGAQETRPSPNQDSPQYKAACNVTLSLIDDTLIGYLELMELIFRENPRMCDNFKLCEPLLKCLFNRFLMAVPDASNKRVTAIASLPDTRTRAFSLLKVMCECSEINLKWICEECTKFVNETPIPITRAGRLDWSFKPTDFRKSPTGFVGLMNQGATCYQNSVLQQLFMAPKLRNWIQCAQGALPLLATSPPSSDTLGDVESNEDEESSILCAFDGVKDNQKNRLLRALQYTLTFLKDSEKRFFNPGAFVGESATLKLMDGHLSQNDAIEFYSRLVDYLEDVSQGHSQCAKLQEMLYVRTCTINVRNCDGKHRTESEVGTPFLTLNVRSGMAGPTLHSLDAALESWFKSEKLSGLECEVCNLNNKDQRFDADQIKCFSKLPPVLVVQLQRFDFDYEIMQPTKLNHRVSFEHRIDLYRFTREAVMQKFEGDQVSKDGGEEEEEFEDEGSDSGNGTPSQPPTPGEKVNSVYELRGVVVHQGSGANFGHYYSFIQDRRSGNWFRFDDERVTPFDIRNLEEECFGGSIGEGGENQSSWNPNNPGGVGHGKFKQFGNIAKDNNAYLLLYELVESPTNSAEKTVVPTMIPQISSYTCLSIGLLSKLYVVLSRSVRKARLSLNAKRRIEQIEDEVNKDNQRTLRHALVMVSPFMDFILSLLMSTRSRSDMDPNVYGLVTRMGIIVATKATIRVSSQKPRLRVWDETIGEMLMLCSIRYPRVICWLLGHLCTGATRDETLEPLLLSCPEKGAREFLLSLTIKTITHAVDICNADDADRGIRGQFSEAVVKFVEAMVDMLPEGVVNCRFMSPYFEVWKVLCKPAMLRNLMYEYDIVTYLLKLYIENDPLREASSSTGLNSRSRCGSLDMNQSANQGGNVDADFGVLVDAISTLIIGKSTQDAYDRDVRSDMYYDEVLSDSDGEDSCDDFEMDGVFAESEDEIEDTFMNLFLQLGQEYPTLRYSRGYPLQGVNSNNEAKAELINDVVALQMARRTPGPGALLLAFKCKKSSSLSKTMIQELVPSLNQYSRLMNCSDLPPASIKVRIKQICHALRAIASVEDGYSADRAKMIVEEGLNACISCHKEVNDIVSRREYQRSSRYPPNMYVDTESDDLYECQVYTLYSLAKILSQLYISSAHCRIWMRKYSSHWVNWLPEWLDRHSYDRCLGGNLNVFTRRRAKGNAVRLVCCVAQMIDPEIRIRLVEPQKVSIEVAGSGLSECNGIYSFDGYFKAGESQQIDTITPKFVKILNGRVLNVYRCLIKDKQYTWYISELSLKPGTNNDVDFYNSPRDNPSSMPPESGWVQCGKGVKPGPAYVRIVQEPFLPDFDPCMYMRTGPGTRRAVSPPPSAGSSSPTVGTPMHDSSPAPCPPMDLQACEDDDTDSVRVNDEIDNDRNADNELSDDEYDMNDEDEDSDDNAFN